MSKRIEAWAVVDTDGSFLAGPSNSRSEAENEAERRWPVIAGPAWKATRFVPHSPTAERVLRAVLKALPILTARVRVATHGQDCSRGDLDEESDDEGYSRDGCECGKFDVEDAEIILRRAVEAHLKAAKRRR